MKEILEKISTKAIENQLFNYTTEEIKSNWLGNKPTTEEMFKKKESDLNVKFPEDYKNFILITNGFSQPVDIEPKFENITDVDYLKNVDSNIITLWEDGALKKIGEDLKRSIIIAGRGQEQYFLLIPPISAKGNWEYWKFASWIPGEERFNDLESYFKSVLQFIDDVS